MRQPDESTHPSRSGGAGMTVGHTKDAGWQIGVSRTIPYDVGSVWAAVVANAGEWLGRGAVVPDEVGVAWTAADGSGGELRSRRELDRVRLTHRAAGASYETTVQVAVRGT